MIDTKRLQSRLAEMGWSQARLAREIGASPPAIQQLISGKTKATRLLPQIASKLNVSQAYLEGTSDSVFQTVAGHLTPDQLASELRLHLNGTAVKGTISDRPTDKIPHPNGLYDPAWLIFMINKVDPQIEAKLKGGALPEIWEIIVHTDSMNPTILKGDTLLISELSKEVEEPDGIWFLSYGGLQMVRRLMPLPGGGFRVSADNPSSPTFEAAAADVNVIGRAFWIGRPLQ